MMLSAPSRAFRVTSATLVKHCGSVLSSVVVFCVCMCVQEMKDQLSSPSAVAQAEKKNRQVGVHV